MSRKTADHICFVIGGTKYHKIEVHEKLAIITVSIMSQTSRTINTRKRRAHNKRSTLQKFLHLSRDVREQKIKQKVYQHVRPTSSMFFDKFPNMTSQVVVSILGESGCIETYNITGI